MELYVRVRDAFDTEAQSLKKQRYEARRNSEREEELTDRGEGLRERRESVWTTEQN